MKHTRPPTLYHRADYPDYEGECQDEGCGFLHALILAIPLSLAMWAGIVWLGMMLYPLVIR